MEAKNKKKKTNLEGWNRSTELGVDVKTILRSDKRMKAGKAYHGVLQMDMDVVVEEYFAQDAHMTFVETVSTETVKHNPRVYDGEYISVTLRDDGTPRPNFKLKRLSKESDVNDYAIGVCNELRSALTGLIENR